MENAINETLTEDDEKHYSEGQCALCGKKGLVDQFGFCEECGKRFVRLDVPLLTIVPIPYIKIGKIDKAFKEGIRAFKETLKEEE